MIKQMYRSASAIIARIKKQQIVANNLANVQTTRFKRGKVEFQDVLYQNVRRAGTSTPIGSQVPVNPAGLSAVGHNFFIEISASGRRLGVPFSGGIGQD